MGLSSAWIDREKQEEKMQELKEQLNFTWRFGSMGEMAEAVDKEFQEMQSGEGIFGIIHERSDVYRVRSQCLTCT
jgi:hypothetical protein